MENLERTALKELANERLLDAQVLYDADRLDGSFYICGYAVEMALKHKICMTLDWDEYPASGKGSDKFKTFKTHDFEVLLHLSGVEKDIKKNLFTEWSVLMKWSSEKRYSSEKQTNEDVKLMIEATRALLEKFMNEIIEKIKAAIASLERDKGPLLICALFLRDDPEKWDIVLSASWLNPREMESYKIVTSKLQNFLSDSELLQFSRVVLLNKTDPVVSFLQELKTIKNGGYEELEKEELSDKFKFTIKRAYLLRCQKLDKA